MLVSGLALWLLRGAGDVGRLAIDVPAAGAMPATKLRLFYAALLMDGAISLVLHGDPPLYFTLLLVFASVPILGHQSIGLTPARQQSATVRRWWWLGWCFPLLAAAFGVALLVERHALT
jgi:hypothetical protein